MAPKAQKKAAAPKAGKAKKAQGVKSVLHSSQLIWHCIRKNSAFLRPNKTAEAKNWKEGPRNKASRVFNAEPGHLTGLNGYAASTLLGNGLALGVQKTGKKETVVTTCKTAKSGKPAKASAVTGVAKNAKKGQKTLNAKIAKAYYRRDMTQKAAKKYAAVLNSFKSKQPKLKISRA